MRIYMKMLLFLALFSFAINVFAQEKAVKGQSSNEENVVKFGIKVKYPVNTYSNFTLTENTKVHRVYSDSSTKDYTRQVIYYYTEKIEDSRINGFQTINIIIDSLNYKFKDGNKVMTYNSVNMSGNANRFRDLDMRTPVLGREFNITYSPYGEVSKINGDNIQELKDYINKNKSYMKPIEVYMWNNAVSLERLSYLGDNKKIIFPKKKFAIDSIWYSPIAIELNGYSFVDTAAMKISQYNAGKFFLKGTMKNLTPLNRDEYMYNVNKLVKINKAVGQGNIEIELTARGDLLRTIIKYRTVIRVLVGANYVDEVIDTSVEWKKNNTFRL